MRQQIVSLSVHQTSKVLAALYALMGLVLVPFFLIASVASPEGAGFGLGFALVLPLIYGAFGYVFVALGCWLYNVVAHRVGGIEMVLAADAE